ncbi:MAG: hypothetical protein NVS1B14_11640 [Vulcanimicrobiaceae bacterium]
MSKPPLTEIEANALALTALLSAEDPEHLPLAVIHVLFLAERAHPDAADHAADELRDFRHVTECVEAYLRFIGENAPKLNTDLDEEAAARAARRILDMDMDFISDDRQTG